MTSYKAPSFTERQSASAQARQKALEKLKSRPPVDPAVLEAQRAAAAIREAAAAEKRAAKKAAEAAAKQAAIEAAAAAKPVELTEAERKAERDRRYAERKARKK